MTICPIGADKYYHCLANCEASARGPVGRIIARILSDGREVTDQLRNTGTDSDKDQEANRRGRAAPSSVDFKDCKTSCEVLLPESMKPKEDYHQQVKKRRRRIMCDIQSSSSKTKSEPWIYYRIIFWTLFTLMVIGLIVHYMTIDACLDLGGRWNEEAFECQYN